MINNFHGDAKIIWQNIGSDYDDSILYFLTFYLYEYFAYWRCSSWAALCTSISRINGDFQGFKCWSTGKDWYCYE